MKEIYILLCEGVVSSHKVCEPFLGQRSGLREMFESIGDRGDTDIWMFWNSAGQFLVRTFL